MSILSLDLVKLSPFFAYFLLFSSSSGRLCSKNLLFELEDLRVVDNSFNRLLRPLLRHKSLIFFPQNLHLCFELTDGLVEVRSSLNFVIMISMDCRVKSFNLACSAGKPPKTLLSTT